MGEETRASWLRDLWDILRSKASIRPMIALGILSALVVFLPAHWLKKIGISAWVNSHWPWILLAFCLCTLMLLIHLVEWQGKRIVDARRISKRFGSLMSDEKRIIREFTDNNAATLNLFPHMPGVGSLIADGILVCVSPEDARPDLMKTYSLTPAARRHIAKSGKFGRQAATA